MKKIFVILISGIVCACSHITSDRHEVCQIWNLSKHLIYPKYNVSINLPNKWSLVDSTFFGGKNLVSTKTIFSKDSTSSVLVIVEKFDNLLRFNSDTNEMRKYLVAELVDRKIDPDSIYSTESHAVSGWKTVMQKSSVRDIRHILFGQILSLKNGEQISLLIKESGKNLEEGQSLLNCIFASYSLAK